MMMIMMPVVVSVEHYYSIIMSIRSEPKWPRLKNFINIDKGQPSRQQQVLPSYEHASKRGQLA